MAVSNVRHAVIRKWRVWFAGYEFELEQTFVQHETGPTARTVTQGARRCLEIMQRSAPSVSAGAYSTADRQNCTQLQQDRSTQKPAAAVTLWQTATRYSNSNTARFACARQQGW